MWPFETLVIVRTAGVDENGDHIAGEQRIDLPVYNLEPRLGGDVAELGRDGYTDGFVVYAPLVVDGAPAPEIRPTDTIEARGNEYELVGTVGDWRNGFAPGVFDGRVFVIGRGVG